MSIKTDFQYYLDHQDELVKKYNGRVVGIKDGEVLGDWASELEAVKGMMALGHKAGTFIVQKCTPGDENYTMTFHSRVSFPESSKCV